MKGKKKYADIGLNVIPAVTVTGSYYRMAVCALSQGKTAEADEILVRYIAKHKELGTPGNNLEAKSWRSDVYRSKHHGSG